VLLEIATIGLGAVVTAIVGTPVAVRLARAELPGFGSPTDTHVPIRDRDVGVTAGFTPLDLGPDPMTWPSSSEWPSPKLRDAEWPSKSWNDEHFGRHWRDGTHTEVPDGGFHAMLQRAPGAAEASPPPKAQPTRSAPPKRPVQPRPTPKQAEASPAEAAFFAGASAAETQRQKAIQQSQQRAREQAKRRQAEAMRQQALRQAKAQKRAPAPAPKPQAASRDRARPQPTSAPDRAELEALVASQGLAGTVQVIMKRTGWDFRKAAQYLARVRAGK